MTVDIVLNDDIPEVLRIAVHYSNFSFPQMYHKVSRYIRT